ncbi:uncharacterized protein LOC108033670 [Drosophila biarmipes]|uniref:uncharacterized protein LOC108033670 n=1 Tax=Drosophila biarmipes TaxID=125945 RepID=UPI0007E82EE7|nr:uncharacterized protein LOC108033670 [Drosophila biarmipes]
MAWVPNSRFEDDLVDMEPGFNLIHGQLAYEAKRKQEFCPRPKTTYEYLAARKKRNSEQAKVNGSPGGKGREIRESLQMMEKIQKIAGTKPLGEHATMADWEDNSTAEVELIAIMRHFGMSSMAEDSLPVLPEIKPPEGPIHVIRNGRRSFPLITDPEFFRACKPRQRKQPSSANDSISDSFHTAEGSSSSISLYGSAHSHLEISHKTPETPKTKKPEREDNLEIPYQPLEESFDQEQQNFAKASPSTSEKTYGRRNKRRPSQKERAREQYEAWNPNQ